MSNAASPTTLADLEGVDWSRIAPRERLVTMPRGEPMRTLGYQVAAWMIDNLTQPNGPHAGQPFTPTAEQIDFLAHFYALDDEGNFVYNRGVRRLAKGSGKALALSTPILTTRGWSTIGDLRVGDEVFSPEGKPVPVVQLHPVETRPTYRVRISDGSTLFTSAEHLWAVDEFVDGRGRRRRVLTTEEMRQEGLVFPRPLTKGRTRAVRGGVARFALPEVAPLQMSERHLPIAPYLLGYWLGDGDSDAARLTVSYQDSQHLFDWLDDGGYRYSQAWTQDHSAARVYVRDLLPRLRELGLLGNKCIPDLYAHASERQRRELLQGLMDSDGSVSRGFAEFCNKNPRLAYGVLALVRSLGGRGRVTCSGARLNGRVISSRYRVFFPAWAEIGAFSLPRKAERQRVRTRKRIPRRIVGISLDRPREMRCITVGSEDGIFLAGRELIPTHNSPFAAAVALAELLGPVRPVDFDDEALGGVIGKSIAMPLVQIIAVSEAQTANTTRMVRAFCQKGGKLARKYDLDSGKTFVDTPTMGRLEQRASSAQSIEGAEASFQVSDELEHWLPNNGGPELMATLRQNAAKTGARLLETCNAWIPGQDSVAEQTFEAWCDQEEGKLRGESRILYDARIAPWNSALTDSETKGKLPLSDALKFVYEDCPWVNIRAIREQIWAPDYPESNSRRFFLNQPNAAEDSWVTLEDWTRLRNLDRKPKPGEEIVMFFDGSKSNDHTALVGCCLEDGHIFKIGHWAPLKSTGQVDVAAVDAGVRRTFQDYTVRAFWADVREWESFVRTTWPEDLGKDLICWAQRGGQNAGPIAWDMRSHAWLFAEATETALTEILERQFTHDGSADLGQHVSNCRVHEYRGLWTVRKDSPKSPRKIDLAVCMIGARMLWRVVRKSEEYAQLHKPRGQWRVLA